MNRYIPATTMEVATSSVAKTFIVMEMRTTVLSRKKLQTMCTLANLPEVMSTNRRWTSHVDHVG